MKPEMITLKHGDVSIKMPSSALAKLAISSVFAQVLPPAENVQPVAPSSIPEIGQPWPGQGGINGGFVHARGDVPAHYLIIAAKDVGDHGWGGRGVEVEGLSKTDGYTNTQVLIGNDDERKYPAADACAEYQADGHHDFYFPAAAELYQGWLNCPEVFAQDCYYWSSSQRSANFAFFMYFGDGYQFSFVKRSTSSVSAPSADSTLGPYPFQDLVQAYYDCRRTKRNSDSALAFEIDLERNLIQLHDDLVSGNYRPGRSICFVVTRPKAREVWAAAFRDRVVHHLMYNHVAPRFYASFIADSCACIPGRGTLYAATRLESKIRSASENWSKPVFYLKCDLANFFVAIDKAVLRKQLEAKITELWWLALATQILMHDPREDYETRSPAHLFNRVPQHKRLVAQPARLGLPIGNLSSQFFANIYLDALDQFAKHQLRAKHYIRYVDDFVFLHESPQQLNLWLAEVEAFLPRLGAKLNPTKTILQPVDRGVDFVGHVIKPWRRTTRKRSLAQALKRTAAAPAEDLRETANSYFGLLSQASHSEKDRAALARIVLKRGNSVNAALTKTFQKK